MTVCAVSGWPVIDERLVTSQTERACARNARHRQLRVASGATARDVHVQVVHTLAHGRMTSHARFSWLVMIGVTGLALHISGAACFGIAVTLSATHSFVRAMIENNASRLFTGLSHRKREALRHLIRAIGVFAAFVATRAIRGDRLIAVMTRLALRDRAYAQRPVLLTAVVALLALHTPVPRV